MKQELREIIETPGLRVLSEIKTEGEMTVRVKFAEADRLLLNKRIYPKALLQREIDRIQEKVKAGAMIGTGDHPADSGTANIATASHIVRSVSLDEQGRGWADLAILPTDRGRNIQSIIRAGGQLGISTRGHGTVDQASKRVNDDYQLTGIDIVIDPSCPDAVFNKSNIFESMHFESEDKGKGVNKMREERISSKPVRQKVQAKDVFLESLLCNTDPVEYAKKINADIDRENKIDEAFTPSQIREARNAGANLQNPEERKKFLDICRSQNRPKTSEEEIFIKFAVGQGLTEGTAKFLWKKKKEEERQKGNKRGRLAEGRWAGAGTSYIDKQREKK